MTETEALLSKASAKLDAARLLLDNGFYDDCISRSYYAMFFAAEAALLDLGLTTSSHKGLHMMFGKHLVQAGTLRRIWVGASSALMMRAKPQNTRATWRAPKRTRSTPCKRPSGSPEGSKST